MSTPSEIKTLGELIADLQQVIKGTESASRFDRALRDFRKMPSMESPIWQMVDCLDAGFTPKEALEYVDILVD